MNCPICEEEMEFEEAKKFHGTWFCECGYEAEGAKIPCAAEKDEDGAIQITDVEETIFS